MRYRSITFLRQLGRVVMCVAAASVPLSTAIGVEARPDVLGYRMQALPGAEVVDLATFRGRPGVLFFFEPGCVWCRRQARLLNELPERCYGPDLQVLGVGIRGSRAALLDEARTLRARFPVFEASPALAGDLGAATATPLLIVFGADGRIRSHARGYQRAEPLARLLSQAIGSDCDA
jgi:peroxiredoxin